MYIYINIHFLSLFLLYIIFDITIFKYLHSLYAPTLLYFCINSKGLTGKDLTDYGIKCAHIHLLCIMVFKYNK